MTETEARQVLLLQSREASGATPHWSADDRRWATRQAVAAVGEDADPHRFVVARAGVALQRLLPRDTAARRWFDRRGWHPAWAVLAAVAGLAAGLAADQLGVPQRVNLLAPAVWAVVAWNLVVYLLLVLPVKSLRPALARFGRGGDSDAGALWFQHAAPLLSNRVAVVLHTAAAALGAGLVAGLYLRGLVLDYRAGWQSTFLTTEQVQSMLGALLSPAVAFTGIGMPDVAPLRVAPGADAVATAAPWIHLYAATLALFVIVPRLLLALRAAWAAGHRARHFRLPLDTPYFESLHPLMRPGLPRAVRLLWVSDRPSVELLGHRLGRLQEPVTLLTSDEGDELTLLPVPDGLDAAMLPAPTSGSPWWKRWTQPGPATVVSVVDGLRRDVDAVLLITAPGQPRPAWLVQLGRPVVVVVDGGGGGASYIGSGIGFGIGSGAVEPPLLDLHALSDGWVAYGRLLRALTVTLEGDARMGRLAAARTRLQQGRLDAEATELASTLARVATIHVQAPESGLLTLRRDGAADDAARQALVAALDAELQAHAGRLRQWLVDNHPAVDRSTGSAAPLQSALVADVADDPLMQGVPAAAAALHARVGEGRAALVGGVLSGALAGFKADLLSGGLTMGAGAVAGGLLGALGAAGAARGLNVVRGSDRSFLAWNEEALHPVTEALLLRHLVLAHDVPIASAREKLAPAMAACQPALSALWRARQRRFDNPDEAAALAQSLQQPMLGALKQSLSAPAVAAGVGVEHVAADASNAQGHGLPHL